MPVAGAWQSIVWKEHTSSVEPTEPPEPSEKPAEASVFIGDNVFSGQTTTISAGTTVAWTHNGRTAHTVTAEDSVFDSGVLNPEDSFAFTFEEPGEFPDNFRFHGAPGGEGMVGIIIITP